MFVKGLMPFEDNEHQSQSLTPKLTQRITIKPYILEPHIQ